MAMTVLEWMKAFGRYNFESATLTRIALDRGIADTSVDISTLSVKDKELVEADMIFEATMFSPSSTASLSISHNGFKKALGSESDAYRNQKIVMAREIYRKYEDERCSVLENIQPRIRAVNMEDLI